MPNERASFEDKGKKAYEVEQLQKAWDDAHDRLLEVGGEGIVSFTSREGDVKAVEKYLQDNQASLSEEAKFFLRATIELRKAKQKL